MERNGRREGSVRGLGRLALACLAGLVAAGSAAAMEHAEADAVAVESEPLAGIPGGLRLRVTNRGGEPVRDVEIVVRHGFLWEDEFHPGDESPARADLVKVDETLAPGETKVVEYRPDPPLPQRDDGQFVSEALAMGWNVGPPRPAVASPAPVE